MRGFRCGRARQASRTGSVHTRTRPILIEKPEDRRQALEPVIAAVGGKLHGFWYAFGDADGYVLAEFPSDVVAASTLTKVAASGAFASVSTTKLLTVEEMLGALHGAGGMAYRAPGAAS